MAEKKKGKRGGARPGSGPKRKLEAARRITVWLTDENLSSLSAYCKEHGLTRSEAIRQLIGT